MAIKLTIAGISETKEVLDNIQYRKAIKHAINETTKYAMSVASREVTKTYNIKFADIKKFMTKIIIFATLTRLYSLVYLTGKRIPLIYFGAKQVLKGVSIKVKKEGGRKLIKGVFIATMKSGHRGVFRRLKGTRMISRPRKEKIAELKGISLPMVLKTGKVFEALKNAVNEKFPKQLGKDLRYFLIIKR